jgi:hypothetical protein
MIQRGEGSWRDLLTRGYPTTRLESGLDEGRSGLKRTLQPCGEKKYQGINEIPSSAGLNEE